MLFRSVGDLREALSKVEAVHEETWTRDNFTAELTRGLTTLENARMEWNGARLKFPALSGQPQATKAAAPETTASSARLVFDTYRFGELCRVGFALTWPLAAVALVALGVFLAVLLRH